MSTEGGEGGEVGGDSFGQRPRVSGSYMKEKPVKVGQELDVTISEISRRGDGVARIEGYVIFVPGGRQGQQAKIRVTSIRPSFATAELVGPASAPQA